MERTLVDYLVNALWQVPLLALGGWIFARLTKPSAHAHHRLWLTILALSVLLPINRSTTMPPRQEQMENNTERLFLDSQPATPAIRSTSKQQTWLQHAPYFSPRVHTLQLTEAATHWLVGLYLSTVVFGLLRLAHGWRTAEQLVERSTLCFVDLDRATLAEYARRFRVPLPQIRKSRELSSPVIVRTASPVLLVPEDFSRYTGEEVRAVLCHELAHVQRRDYAVNLACQIVALPLFWHPAVHHIQQRIRMTREMVCDALAAQHMESSIGYAKCLLTLAHSMLGRQTWPQEEYLTGLFSSNTLEERVMRLTETPLIGVRAKLVRVTSGAAIMVASCAAAAMLHLSPTLAASGTAFPAGIAQVTSASPSTQTASPALPPVTAAPKERSQRKKTAEKQAEAHPSVMVNDHEFKKQIEEAQAQALRAEQTFNTPEFRKQIEEARQQALKVQATFDSPEFKKQIEDAQREALAAAARFDSPEFKKQIEEAQRQALKASAALNNPDFKKQMEDAQQQALKAKEMLQDPAFKRQMEVAQQQALKAKDFLNSEAFRKQMEDAQQQALKAKEMLQDPAFKKQMEDMKEQWKNGTLPIPEKGNAEKPDSVDPQ